jgi:hypothetical protein
MAAVFTISEQGTVIASWDQSLTPSPFFYLAGKATIVPIHNATGDAAGDVTVDYLNAAFSTGGGDGGVNDAANFYIKGPQYYTGLESAPVFELGSYTGGTDSRDGLPATLTISVPEPATWGMMLAGLGLVGFVARRRRNVSVTYA